VKRILSLITVILITVLALGYALWDVDFAELGELLSGGKYWVLVPFLMLLVAFYWMKALRWVYLLRPVGQFTTGDVMPSMIIGFAANNLLPAHLGELIRTGIFSHRFRKPISSVAITLLVERIFDLVAILSLYAIAMATLGTPPESLEIGAWFITLLMACFFAAIAVVLYKPSLVLNTGNRLGTYLPERFHHRLNGLLENILHAFSSLRSPGLIAAMTVWSVLKWLLMGSMIWLTLFAYGDAISPNICLVLMAVLALAAAVPNAPGYIGAIQAAYVFALRPFGVSEETAFAASIMFLVSQWVPVTIAGAIYFISGGLHVAEVRREIEEVEEEQEAAGNE
jgi:glycosyltransferase 2 family protein